MENKEEKKSPEEEMAMMKSDLVHYRTLTTDNLEFFGYPFQKMSAEAAKRPEREGYVNNPLLGLVHWSVVKYALDKKYISWKNDEWCVVGIEQVEGRRKVVDTSTFNRFAKRLKLLQEEERKRDFAIKQSADGFDEFIGKDLDAFGA